MKDLYTVIPGLWTIQCEIDSAYRGMRFCWNEPKEYEVQESKHKKWLKEKEKLLKPIFGT